MAVLYSKAPEGQRLLVTMPDGYRVWPDEQHEDHSFYFGTVVEGIGEHGERVTVRGSHVSRVSMATTMPFEVEYA